MKKKVKNFRFIRFVLLCVTICSGLFSSAFAVTGNVRFCVKIQQSPDKERVFHLDPTTKNRCVDSSTNLLAGGKTLTFAAGTRNLLQCVREGYTFRTKDAANACGYKLSYAGFQVGEEDGAGVKNSYNFTISENHHKSKNLNITPGSNPGDHHVTQGMGFSSLVAEGIASVAAPDYPYASCDSDEHLNECGNMYVTYYPDVFEM